jgi:uncharacterized oligopeptide transporter (OPT) family protein
VEEQLAFPSGTATAQLIAVLHRLPPPGTEPAHVRKGYRAIGVEDENVPSEGQPRPSEDVTAVQSDATDELEAEGEKIRRAGWTALGWSFLASSLMTVGSCYECAHFTMTTWHSSCHTSSRWSSLFLSLGII